MVDLVLELVVSVIGGFFTDILISAVFSHRRTRARRDRSTGRLVLEYGALLKACPFAIASAFALLTVTMATTVVIRTDQDLLYGILFVVFWTVLTGVFAAEVFGVSFELGETGIRKRSPWSRGFFSSWEEVTSVSFNQKWEYYVVDTLKGRMRLSVLLNGLGDFRTYVRERLPASVVRLSLPS